MNDLISRQWLVECVNEGWIKFDTAKDENRFIHLVRDIAPSAEPERDCSEFPNSSDTISRQAAIDAVDSETVSTNPEHFKSSEKFIKFMDDADIASFGKWQWANGFNTALTAARVQLKNLPSAEPELNKQELIRTMNAGIIATSTEDVYSCGMRNGIRWCRALLEDNPPKFEDASQYAEPERKKGNWIPYSKVYECRYECSSCGYHLIGIHESEANFCPNCGADMRSKEEHTMEEFMYGQDMGNPEDGSL